MEWYLALLFLLSGLVVLMLIGLPVAFSFLIISMVWMFFLWGGEAGLEQLVVSVFESLTRFGFVAIPLFILMGEVMFQSGIAPRMIESLDKWLGRLPGRLGLLAVGSGSIFATLTGVSLASVALMGSTLTPEMEKRGYKKSMSLGPILGSGGLAIMIPPSQIAVFLAVIAVISVGKTLIAIIVPGVLMAVLYAVYIIVRCHLQPSIAPAYEVPHIPLSVKLVATAKYILPLGFIIFMVTGVIFLGIATPSEAAATGALSCFILAAAYRRLSWEVVKKAFANTAITTGMLFMLLSGSKAFSEILAFTEASKGLISFTTDLPLSPIVIVIAMHVILLFLGMFMSAVSIIMITMPLFMPIIHALGLDPVWFGISALLNMEMAVTSPPFGLTLFAMKGVAPPGTTIADCYRAALPFLGCDLVILALIIAFPQIALWLPSVML